MHKHTHTHIYIQRVLYIILKLCHLKVFEDLVGREPSTSSRYSAYHPVDKRYGIGSGHRVAVLQEALRSSLR